MAAIARAVSVGRQAACITARASGVRTAEWKGRLFHAFRKAFKTQQLAAGASADAVDYLQGHSLGGGRNSRGRYIDGSLLPLAAVVARIPAINGATNVVQLPKRGTMRAAD